MHLLLFEPNLYVLLQEIMKEETFSIYVPGSLLPINSLQVHIKVHCACTFFFRKNNMVDQVD